MHVNQDGMKCWSCGTDVLKSCLPIQVVECITFIIYMLVCMIITTESPSSSFAKINWRVYSRIFASNNDVIRVGPDYARLSATLER